MSAHGSQAVSEPTACATCGGEGYVLAPSTTETADTAVSCPECGGVIAASEPAPPTPRSDEEKLTDGLCEDCSADVFLPADDPNQDYGPIGTWWLCGACITKRGERAGQLAEALRALLGFSHVWLTSNPRGIPLYEEGLRALAAYDAGSVPTPTDAVAMKSYDEQVAILHGWIVASGPTGIIPDPAAILADLGIERDNGHASDFFTDEPG